MAMIISKKKIEDLISDVYKSHHEELPEFIWVKSRKNLIKKIKEKKPDERISNIDDNTVYPSEIDESFVLTRNLKKYIVNKQFDMFIPYTTHCFILNSGKSKKKRIGTFCNSCDNTKKSSELHLLYIKDKDKPKKKHYICKKCYLENVEFLLLNHWSYKKESKEFIVITNDIKDNFPNMKDIDITKI